MYLHFYGKKELPREKENLRKNMVLCLRRNA
jgi:hypothetical protein